MKTKTSVKAGLDWQLPNGGSVSVAEREKWLLQQLGIGLP
jgi:hypothetical protein